MPIEGLGCGVVGSHGYQYHFLQIVAPHKYVESVSKDIPVKRNKSPYNLRVKLF
jgi:hypothetical protein